MTDQPRTEAQAYAHFVDYACFLTVMPFHAQPAQRDAICEFFEEWLNLAEKRGNPNEHQC
jgi:hypothetical protein